MLTIFSVPKPFRGHIGVIQRNALQSWRLLHRDVEVLLFGEEEGVAETCRELRLRHEPHVECNELGTPLLSYVFDRAQQIACHDIVCYSNCDILLPGAFAEALARVSAWRQQFLMVGQRWDLHVFEPLDFSRQGWNESLQIRAMKHGVRRAPEWIDYFAFRRGLCKDLPPFAVGRPLWDDWLLWKVRTSGAPVVDASQVVVAIHQNHDYAHHPGGMQGVREGEEFRRNRALAGSWRHLYSIADASHVLEENAIRRTYRHWRVRARREFDHVWSIVGPDLLRLTRPARHRVGLRQENLARLLPWRRRSQ